MRIGSIIYSADTNFVVDSKSLKLYINSFNNAIFDDETIVRETIIKDIGGLLKAEVNCELRTIEVAQREMMPKALRGTCLDNLAIEHSKAKQYQVMLEDAGDVVVAEEVHTHLLRSKGTDINLPDFGSLFVRYSGHKINAESLSQYVISLREHGALQEQRVEKVFAEIWMSYLPEALLVAGYYARREGVEINSIRVLHE